MKKIVIGLSLLSCCVGLQSMESSKPPQKVVDFLKDVRLGNMMNIVDALTNQKFDFSKQYNFGRPFGSEVLFTIANGGKIKSAVSFKDEKIIIPYLNLQDKDGNTAAIVAFQNYHPRTGWGIIRFLNADPNILNNDNQTVLDIIIEKLGEGGLGFYRKRGYTRAKNWLINNGAKTGSSILKARKSSK